MLSRSTQRALGIALKLYGFIIISFFTVSYTTRFLQSRRDHARAAKMDRWLKPQRAPNKHIVYHFSNRTKPSDRHYFDDKSSSITAEDVLNTVDFNHPSELTSSVPTNYQYLSDVRVSTKGPVRILSWTIKYFRPPGPWYPEGSEAFSHCELEPWMRCEYTHDRKYLNHSEALLFHPQHIFDLPQYRISNQKWIFWELDSPLVTWRENPHLDRFGHMFNVTSTYALDSTVPIPYIHICNAKSHPLKPEEHPNYAKGKRGRVAWLSFACQTSSHREDFVKELQKYIPVDVYGFCGPMSCENHKGDDCLKKVLQTKYKFYLALEESFCKHVLSQNVWKVFSLQIQMLPVILGAANYSDYYPEGTYIDARGFRSVKNLAEYLLYLDRNDAEYNKYFINRGKLVCGFATNYKNYLCQLCRHLHNYRRQREYVRDVSQYWDVKRLCVDAKYFYQNHFTAESDPQPWWSQIS